jgi:hypothetical protein
MKENSRMDIHERLEGLPSKSDPKEIISRAALVRVQ